MKKLFLSKKFFFDSLSSPHILLLYSYSKLLSFQAKSAFVSLNNILRDIIGTNKGFKYLEKRHEVKHSIPTFQKSIDLLGYEHKTTMEDGLKQMWDWAKEQPMKPRFKWKNYELDKCIYSFWR